MMQTLRVLLDQTNGVQPLWNQFETVQTSIVPRNVVLLSKNAVLQEKCKTKLERFKQLLLELLKILAPV